MRLFAKKSLGQHFLNSPSVLAKIISAGNIQKGETVLEIGPGTGVLTAELLKTGAKIIAVEKDDRAESILNQKFKEEIISDRLKIIHGDILDEKIFNDPNQLDNSIFKDGSYALIANIPYYITGAILEKFLEHEPRPNRMVLLVQKEVAERIVARDRKESILSISVKAFGTPKIISNVPRGAFTPPPNVESAILSIENISDKQFSIIGLEIRLFFDVVKAGFAHKRKVLKRNLEMMMSQEKISKIWQKLRLNEKVRAEDLKPEQWFHIAKN